MTNPNKIIHIITGLGVGGAEQMLKRLLLSDPHSIDNVLVISLSGLGAIGKTLQAQGFNVQAFNFNRLSAIPANFWALVKLLKAHKPAIIQTWMYHADFLVVWLLVWRVAAM